MLKIKRFIGSLLSVYFFLLFHRSVSEIFNSKKPDMKS
ncbi:hypothetical protein MY9_3994 [Bacillus sp. JS]|nr:hypothetical protein MY9_3994 [Bacillus sp. JS]